MELWIKTISLAFLMGLTTYINAQDLITLSNGEKINAAIIKNTEKEITYKREDFPDGPDFVVSKSRVISIDYRNGTSEKNELWDNPRFVRPTSIALGVGVSYENEGSIYSRLGHFVNPKIELQAETVELDGGLNIGLGARYHFNSTESEKSLSPFVGFMLTEGGGFFEEGMSFRIPVGMNYIGKKGFNFSLSLNHGRSGNIFDGEFSDEGFVAFSVGYSFKRRD